MRDPLKEYRKRFRIWNNDRRLQHERRFYEAAFASRNLTIPDDAAIRRGVIEKFPRLQPKKKGALRIFAIYHHYNWENSALKPALEKFGTVRHYDWFEQFKPPGGQWHYAHRVNMNRDLVERLGQWMKEDSADLIFSYVSGEQVTLPTVKELQAFRVPMVNLALNDKENFVGKIRQGQAMGVRDICRFFTLCWTSTEDAVKKYCVEGATPIYLTEGANPEIHTPHDMQKTIDVSFVGQCYGNRSETIKRLGSQGINVEAYGYGWPNGPLSTEDMVRMYSKSKINLGFGGVISHSDTYCLKGRDFEIPMSGGLYVTEYHPELEKFYDLGSEIMTYNGSDDLVTKIRFLLSDPEKAEEIRKKGLKRARREHSWEMRFQKIFNLLGLI